MTVELLSSSVKNPFLFLLKIPGILWFWAIEVFINHHSNVSFELVHIHSLLLVILLLWCLSCSLIVSFPFVAILWIIGFPWLLTIVQGVSFFSTVVTFTSILMIMSRLVIWRHCKGINIYGLALIVAWGGGGPVIGASLISIVSLSSLWLIVCENTSNICHFESTIDSRGSHHIIVKSGWFCTVQNDLVSDVVIQRNFEHISKEFFVCSRG